MEASSTASPALEATASSEVFQPASGLSIILGRPTADSVAVSLLSDTEQPMAIEYGTLPGSHDARTQPATLKANVPHTIEISGLDPDTAYFYRVLLGGSSSGEHGFHTQRAPGSTFTFTIDADPHHGDPRFNGDLYTLALSNALADRPDFHIDLGDTFMTEKLHPRTSTEAEATFAGMRPYLGVLAADAPLFLVNGNHEGELGWLLSGRDASLPLWSTSLRQAYFPGPTAGAFYTGSAATDPDLGMPRDGYYAWTWGDALFIVLDPFWYTPIKPSPDDRDSNWGWTLGKGQYDWLRSTLENSEARFKFVFVHHLVGGAAEARGGVEVVPFFEWGGLNADGTYGFDDQRPGWDQPIHALLAENGVSAVFHGHDHLFAYQELDGIVYQEAPQPSVVSGDRTRLAEEGGYQHGTVLEGSGHLRVTVSTSLATVDFVSACLPQDERPGSQNGRVVFTYTIP